MKKTHGNPKWEDNQLTFINTLTEDLKEGDSDVLTKLELGIFEALCKDSKSENLNPWFKKYSFYPVFAGNKWVINIPEYPQLPEMASKDWIMGFARAMMDGNLPEDYSQDFRDGYDAGGAYAEAEFDIQQFEHQTPNITVPKIGPLQVFLYLNNMEEDEIQELTRMEGFLDIFSSQLRFFREWCTTDTSADYIINLIDEMENDEDLEDGAMDVLRTIAEGYPNALTELLDIATPIKEPEPEPRIPPYAMTAVERALKLGMDDFHRGKTPTLNPYPTQQKDSKGNDRGNPLHMAWQAGYTQEMYKKQDKLNS